MGLFSWLVGITSWNLSGQSGLQAERRTEQQKSYFLYFITTTLNIKEWQCSGRFLFWRMGVIMKLTECVWERQGDVYASVLHMHAHDFIQAARWWMLLGWCARTERQRGTSLSEFMTDAVQRKSPFRSLIPSVTAKASLTQPSSFLWVVTRPAAATLYGRKWI